MSLYQPFRDQKTIYDLCLQKRTFVRSGHIILVVFEIGSELQFIAFVSGEYKKFIDGQMALHYDQ